MIFEHFYKQSYPFLQMNSSYIFNTLIQQGCIKLIKGDGKDIYSVSKYFFVLSKNFLFIKEFSKKTLFPQIY